MSNTIDSTRSLTVHDDVSLDNFFARPILISTTTFTPGVSYGGTTFDPWSLYLTNNRVANRMSNYKLFSGKLNLKFMINGNSFYYGRYMASYAPMGTYDLGYTGGAVGTVSSLMQDSQRLKLFIDPSESQGGTMELPFIWYADMLDLTAAEYNKMGFITLEQFTNLKHANGSVSPITLSIFAWMTDVKLSAPTVQDITGITPQAGDEYGQSPYSGTASAVSRAAGSLSSVPMIGPYMKATSIAAGAMSSVMKAFGFSRPVNLEEAKPVRQKVLSELAVTDVSDSSTKLTVDSRQELSVDPRIVGIGTGDEMSLKHIASIETYFTQFTWTTAATSDTLLLNGYITPSFATSTTGTLGALYTIPACTFASAPFKYWRGTMRYRFIIVASAFHKGRLKFTWDPNFSNATTETNVQYTKIVDISNERDFVIDCSWGQPKAWLQTAPVQNLPGNIWKTTRWTAGNNFFNGVLTVTVLNELATPNSVANNDITVLAFMSMCEDDAEFSCPNDAIQQWSMADAGVQPQSGLEIEPQDDIENEQLDNNNAPEASASTEEFVSCAPSADNMSLVYMGETISSLRQMIKRYSIDYHYANVGPGLYSLANCDFPMKFGYTSNGIRGTSPARYDKCNTTFLRYCAMAYLFYRGGIRRKYVVSSNTTAPQFGHASITRTPGLGGGGAQSTTTITLTNANTISDTMLTWVPLGLAGTSMTTLRQNQVVEAELPFYRDVRFALCRRPNTTNLSTTAAPFVEDLVHFFSCNIWTPSTANIFTSFVAGAEDSSFYCFQGCVPFYINPTLV